MNKRENNNYCDWCKKQITDVPVEHMDYDEFAFCSELCAKNFLDEASQREDAKEEAND